MDMGMERIEEAKEFTYMWPVFRKCDEIESHERMS